MAETGFIPFLYNNFHRYGDLERKKNFDKLYRYISDTTFFSYIPNAKEIWNKEKWYNSVEEFSLAGVISAFYVMHAQYQGKTIWGDKTPSYIGHLDLINQVFPNAKFIHILRDVRDYCISVNKAWGKNIYRASQVWVDKITKCQTDVDRIQCIRYFELRYEDLLDDPQQALKRISSFIGIDFEPDILNLKVPSENLGDTRGHCEIVKHNYGKWKSILNIEEIKQIEKIAGALLDALGYDVLYVKGSKKISATNMFRYRISDSINLLIFRRRTTGSFRQALKWIVRYRGSVA